jgi:hypothetical protein
MLQGSCLCGGVRFQLKTVNYPFELCHCTRCRKAGGSAFLPECAVLTADFEWIAGRELVRKFELPVRKEPPAYSRVFCSVCGCLVPDPDASGEWMGIPVSALDDEIEIVPQRHIFVEHKAKWHQITGSLPQLDEEGIIRFRAQAAAAKAGRS